MIVFLLIATFILSTYIIKLAKYTSLYFFNISLLVITPPLFLLIYTNLFLAADLLSPQITFILNPIINEISFIYIKALLFFSFLILLLRNLLPPLLIPKEQNLPSIATIFITFSFFKSIEFIASQLNLSIHLRILFGEITNLSLVILICTLIINLKINQSIFKFILLSLITIVTFFVFTFDKGFSIALCSSIFLILLGSKKLNIKVNLLQTNLMILGGGFLLPLLNFVEDYYLKQGTKTFNALLEVMESHSLSNFYAVFYSPTCNYTFRKSIFDSLISPFKAILGMNVDFHANKLMDICFPLAKANGHMQAFGLIVESALSNELPAFLYFSLAAIAFVLILEFLYYRFSFFGLLVYSQSIEIIYKLTRNDLSGTIYFLLYTIFASYIVCQTILIVDSYFSSKRFIN
tara:strand:- start:3791 stop:5008 length:1218 start_codon:yes stop_codon:yes gene_type:complete